MRLVQLVDNETGEVLREYTSNCSNADVEFSIQYVRSDEHKEIAIMYDGTIHSIIS